MTGSHAMTGTSVSTTAVPVSVSTAGSPTLSRMWTFLMLGVETGGTLSNVFVKDGPTFQTPALSSESIARTRQKYVLLSRTTAGESEVPSVEACVWKLMASQQTFEPVAQSEEKLTSTW